MLLTPLPLVRRIELALLAPHIARAEVEAGCAAAVQYDCVSVIVKPHYIELARKLLKESHVQVASVIAFPGGGSSTATKMYATQDLLQRGAQEITMLINIGALRDREDLIVKNDIAGVVKTARGHPITVILETGWLTDEEKTRAGKIAETAGASFIQNTTGFCAPPASPADVRLLNATCPNLKIKAASDRLTQEAALQLIEAGAARIVLDRLEDVLS